MGNRVPKSELLACQSNLQLKVNEINSCQGANNVLNTSYNSLLNYYTIPNTGDSSFRVFMGTRSRTNRFIRYDDSFIGIPVTSDDALIHILYIKSAITEDPYVYSNSSLRLQFSGLNTFIRFDEPNTQLGRVILQADGLATDEATLFELRPVKYDKVNNRVVTPQQGTTMTFDELVDTDVRKVNVNEAYLLYHVSSQKYIGIERDELGASTFAAADPNSQVPESDYYDFYWDLTFNQYTSRTKQINPNAFTADKN